MNQRVFNRILFTILIFETIFVAGILGYRIGESKEAPQPVYYITLQVDPSMIEYKETPNSVDELVKKVEGFVRKSEKVEPSYTEEDVIYLAKTVYGEARGLSRTEQSAVVWTILNRCDDSRFGESIIDVITAPKQFAGYKSTHPVDPDIRELVIDVLNRWEREKSGETNVGRTLPKDYLYFRGDGYHNYFTKSWNSRNVWDWSFDSPYD